MQTAWYKTVTGQIANSFRVLLLAHNDSEPFGVPLDTRHTYTKSGVWFVCSFSLALIFV